MEYEKYKQTVAQFYAGLKEVWPKNDLWHRYTHRVIDRYVKKNVDKFSSDGVDVKIINIGSGGNTYGIKNEMYHIDVAENKISGFKNFAVGSADDIPVEGGLFDILICVGTVINYCNAEKAISEMSRVLKNGGKAIIEFENSYNPEFKKFDHYEEEKAFISSEYFGEEHSYWVYSYDYIKSLLKKNGFIVTDTLFFHVISSYIYSKTYNAGLSTVFAKLDFLFHKRGLKNHCANIILTAVRGEDYDK